MKKPTKKEIVKALSDMRDLLRNVIVVNDLNAHWKRKVKAADKILRDSQE